MPGLSLKLKGSRFGRVCSIPRRRVRGSVAWIFFIVEGFEVWARVLDSRSKGSRFCRLGFLIEGFEIWARVFDSTSKGSRFGRLDLFYC